MIWRFTEGTCEAFRRPRRKVFLASKNFNLFDNFSRAELAEVTKLLHLQEFKKGQIITIPLDNKERRIYILLI